jgi:hypothetical protein
VIEDGFRSRGSRRRLPSRGHDGSMVPPWYVQIVMFAVSVGVMWGCFVMYDRVRDAREYGESLRNYVEDHP